MTDTINPDDLTLPDAVSTDSSAEINTEKVNQVGGGICALLNGSSLTPNEAFLALIAVVGSVSAAASPSIVDQMEMRVRFCHGVLSVGTHLLRVELNPNTPPSTNTPQ